MSNYELPGLQVSASPRFTSAWSDRCLDRAGNEYIDLAMGFGVRLFGHSHAASGVVHGVVAGAAPGLGDLYTHDLRENALEMLCRESAASWSGIDADGLSAAIWHTGSEAVETALKTALRATGRTRIIAFDGAYHGTFGLAMASSAHTMFRASFASQLSDAVSWTSWSEIPKIDESVACVIVEPIQGRAGVRIPPTEFLPELRSACTATGALLVLDEVLTGSGRSGDMLAGGDAAPDIVALGKALGGGVPASATIARRDVAEAAWGDVRGEAIHTSTWIGEPIACSGMLRAHEMRAKTRSIRSIESDAWKNTLTAICAARSWELRGTGMMWAIDMGEARAGWDASQILLHDHHIIVVPSGYDGRSITLLPAAVDGSDARERLTRSLIA